MLYLPQLRLLSLVLTLLLASSSVQAHFIDTFAILNGANLGTASTATGTAQVQLDLDLVTMRVVINFTGLNGTSVSANLFVPLPPNGPGEIVANPPFLAFPVAVTSGTYDETFDLTVASGYDPAFIVAAGGTLFDAINALHDALDAGEGVIKISSSAFGSGEIGGTLFAVPEPTTVTLFSLAAVGLIVRRARRTRQVDKK